LKKAARAGRTKVRIVEAENCKKQAVKREIFTSWGGKKE